MANHTIDVSVSPNPSLPPGTWTFSVDGGIPQSTAQLDIPFGEISEIKITIAANGQATDTCVFSSTPLTFVNEQHETVGTPPSIQDITPVDSSTITFLDDHTELTDPPTRTLRFLINAIYNTTDIQSPDPTIVNDGTSQPIDGESRPSQSQPQPVAAG